MMMIMVMMRHEWIAQISAHKLRHLHALRRANLRNSSTNSSYSASAAAT